MDAPFEKTINALQFLKKQGIGKKEFLVNTSFAAWVAKEYYKERRCTFCDEEGLAVGYCTDCSQLIDEQCVTFHNKIVDLKNHRIIYFKNCRRLRITEFAPRQFCSHSRHKHLKLTHYCTNCCILICQRCLKHHTKKNHYVNSVYQLCDLLDHIHDTKLVIEDILVSSTILNPADITKLVTIVKYIGISLGISNNYKDICDMPVPQEIQNLVEREESSSHVMKCEAVIEIVKETKRYLQLHFMNGRQDRQNEESCDNSDDTSPKQVVDTIIEGQQHDDSSSRSSLSTDTSLIRSQSMPSLIPSAGFGPITIASLSFTTDDLFPSMQQPEDENNPAKTIEQEIEELQQALDNQINLDSYNDIHE
ncbi:Hypothetical predicted protein [Mytilus galloprovincialis]|uniref:B box-type domain-containing protein n=1 Tax=Mytilus galloprovincialis TaxID=29158 RepID=A0A8B6F777_MYTGA|nr:Hypothetical predicted protein [Mytilus galloprovincialis]